MEYLNFSLFALNLFKYQHSLFQSGFKFQLENGSNLFRDVIIISRQESFRTFHFAAVSYQWDRYRQFSLSTSNTEKYFFMINPVNYDLIRVNSQELSSILCPPEIPHDLKLYGEEIMKIIRSLCDKIKNDKLTHDSGELSH